MSRWYCALLLVFAFATQLPAAPPPSHEWMVLLAEPPVVERFPGRIEQTRIASASYRQHLRDAQQDVRAQIAAMSVTVTGAVQHLLNGIFVRATPEQAAALRNLPGVQAVLPLRRYHLMDQLSLSDVQQAWDSVPIGGAGNAGAGLKIAIIDTGIDQTHPSFQDDTLTPPAGFPKCGVPSDCAFTNSKVIVARSYVSTPPIRGPTTSRRATSSDTAQRWRRWRRAWRRRTLRRRFPAWRPRRFSATTRSTARRKSIFRRPRRGSLRRWTMPSPTAWTW
jgi:hypothetical protein